MNESEENSHGLPPSICSLWTWPLCSAFPPRTLWTPTPPSPVYKLPSFKPTLTQQLCPLSPALPTLISPHTDTSLILKETKTPLKIP